MRVTPPFQSLTRKDATRLMVDLCVPTNPILLDCTTESMSAGYLSKLVRSTFHCLHKRGDLPFSVQLRRPLLLMIDIEPADSLDLLPPGAILFIARHDDIAYIPKCSDSAVSFLKLFLNLSNAPQEDGEWREAFHFRVLLEAAAVIMSSA